MRILLFCNKLPYPPKDGGAVALYNMIKGYHEAGVSLTVLALNTHKHYYPPASIPSTDVLSQVALHTVEVNTDVTITGAIANLFSGKAYHASRFRQKPVQEKLLAVLQQNAFDVVQMEEVYLSPYVNLIRQHSNANILLRAHNVEHAIWEKVAKNRSNPLKKAYLKLQARRLKHFEHAHIPRFDALMPINQSDLATFRQMGFRGPALALPSGINLSDYHVDFDLADPHLVFHLGAMDWQPNQDALAWFVKHVWPGVKAAMPKAELALAGRNMPDPSPFGRYEGVTVYGEVASARAFMQKGGVMVVPLQSGSGMRIKILEGMALGKAIVTTSLGASGIPVTDGHDVLIADEPEAFTNSLLRCLRYPGYQQALGKRARETVARHYDLSRLAKQALAFLQNL